jgi:hypothetical protein
MSVGVSEWVRSRAVMLDGIYEFDGLGVPIPRRVRSTKPFIHHWSVKCVQLIYNG